MQNNTKHYGITGGIGSGKSMVCGLFSILGVPIFNADAEAKKLYHTDATLAEWVKQQFGPEVYEQNRFQPKVLASKVFGNPEALVALNAQVHPRIRQKAAEWRTGQVAPYTLTEAALMMESGSYLDYDAIVLVEAPLEIRLKRITQRDGVSEEQALQRLQAQWTDEQRRPLANYIITNDEHQALMPQVMQLHAQWMMA